MVEKPTVAEAPSDLAIIGRYVLTPDIFEAIETSGAGKLLEVDDESCHIEIWIE